MSIKQKRPRFMIAATGSGSGKTTIMCGILSALKQAGYRGASYKCGPDYIDPMFHSEVFQIPSRNLDLFFSSEEEVKYLFTKSSKGVDISVMEGVMGYYDGMMMDSTKASSYDLARVTKTPTVLIINCSGMALSMVPMIKGFLEFRKDNTIKGVILNQVSKMTGAMLAPIIEKELPVKVYGCIPKFNEFHLASRHLGLVTPFELKEIKEDIDKLGEIITECVDIEGLMELARSAEDLEEECPVKWEETFECFRKQLGKEKRKEDNSNVKIRLAVARDKAFCFYYKDNLEVLEQFGCELVPFSPLEDKYLPESIDALLLGGGYPEVYAKQLSDNVSMREDIRTKITSGLPCLAECGGFMYLHKRMEDEEGTFYPMVGVIDGEAANQKKLVRFGYINISGNKENPYLCPEKIIKGHEFHYWDSSNNGDTFRAQKPSGKRGWDCVHGTAQMIAGYPHLYYYSNLEMIGAFLSQCT